MPDHNIILEPLGAIDDQRLMDFAAAVWGEEERAGVVRKWWRTSDFADVLAATDGKGGPIAALCVGVPSRWSLPEGEAVDAISICGWYVHPDHAGKGLGQWLVRSFPAAAFNALSISQTAIRGFTKLGWTGPYRSQLRLLPLPRVRGKKLPEGWRLRSFVASADDMPDELAAALDRIEEDRPALPLRRRRSARDWRAHLSARPSRRPTFHVLALEGKPIGYAIIRPSDDETGAIYRRARLHFVSDFVCNRQDSATVDRMLGALAGAAPRSAGALLLCTSQHLVAERAARLGWLNEDSPIIGPRLAAKAPAFMVGGVFTRFADEDWQLTFADSDVDLNI